MKKKKAIIVNIVVIISFLIMGCHKSEPKRILYLREDGYLIPSVDMLPIKQYNEAPEDWEFICKHYPYKRKVPLKIVKRLEKIGFVVGKAYKMEHRPTPSELTCWCDGYYKRDIIK